MKEYLKCRACGYIMEKEKSPDICPACGAGKAAFWGYRYDLSERRRIIMSIHIHPVILHIAQAATVIIPVCVALSYIAPFRLSIKFIFTAEILSYLLPFSVLAAFVSGMFDGHNRFKKLNTPALRKKMMLGIALLVTTAAMPANILMASMGAAAPSLIILSVVSLALEVMLARTGVRLMEAHMPG